MSVIALNKQFIDYYREEILYLAKTYYPENPIVIKAAHEMTPLNFLRLFITAHGMKPLGTWNTHTYVNYEDFITKKNHFFLIPAPIHKEEKKPFIRIEENFLKIDDITTNIFPQAIPHTTPFWYFHYDPNNEENPYYSMTLNLSPSCLEKCVLCAGAKTGRVNNGMESTLSAKKILERIFNQHPAAKKQLDNVAVVTGCFANFTELTIHLSEVKEAILEYCTPSIFRVLEHNVTNENEFETIVKELGYDVFITLECFDQKIRNIALNGKVGRKGRDSKEFLSIIKNYAKFLEDNSELMQRIIKVTYLMGLDSLETTEYFFQKLSEINQTYQSVTVIPWLSIFTTYSNGMKKIQQPHFGLPFLLEGIDLCKKYFDMNLLTNQSGTTSVGYARGLF